MAATPRPPVVGLYGVSASGKSHTMNIVKQILGTYHFTYYEGAEVIAQLVPGGLETFQRLSEHQKQGWRTAAITHIRQESVNSGKVTVVAGHHSLWSTATETAASVLTSADLATYTHIIYLSPSPQVVVQQCQADETRQRPQLTEDQIASWQQYDLTELRNICYKGGILFSVISAPDTVSSGSPSVASQVVNRLQDFRMHTESHNLQRAKLSLDVALRQKPNASIVLALDADKTLAPADTGTDLWHMICDQQVPSLGKGALKTMFDELGYTHKGFRQAMFLYEDIATMIPFDEVCKSVSLPVMLWAGMRDVLQLACLNDNINVVIITCGPARVWQEVIDELHLPQPVHVVGGGRLEDGFVVTPKVKGELVSYLQEVYHKTVYAVGDSPVDISMLQQADEAFVAVPEEHIKSRSMEATIAAALRAGTLKGRQLLLSPFSLAYAVDPRLQVVRLEQFPSVLSDALESNTIKSRILDFTDDLGGKVLTTMLRDSSLYGPVLRKAHSDVGEYLALRGLTKTLGLEQCQIPHVQGTGTIGHKINHGAKTTVVALMRGGEPMAFGVNDRIDPAMFVHAKVPDDLKLEHINGQSSVVLVDSVVNSGKSVVEFIDHIRGLSSTILISIVAGVVQEESVRPAGLLGKVLFKDDKLNLITLRMSKNKYTGAGGTDTGNRLFNTKHLP